MAGQDNGRPMLMGLVVHIDYNTDIVVRLNVIVSYTVVDPRSRPP